MVEEIPYARIDRQPAIDLDLGQQRVKAVGSGRNELGKQLFSIDRISVVIDEEQFEHSFVGCFRIRSPMIAQVAIHALNPGIGMAGFPGYLLVGDVELGVARCGHFCSIPMAVKTSCPEIAVMILHQKEK